MRHPFTLYKEKTKSGLVWYIRFWDEATGRYALSRSTGILVEGKRERRREAEEKARSMLPTIRFNPQTADKSFVQYVADFWLPDSPYVRECALIKKKPLSAKYIKLNHEDVKRHIEPFSGFQRITLRTLTAGIIRDWMGWAAGRGLSGRRINTVLQSMRGAVRYAVSREELKQDPFRTVKDAADTPKEKGILSLDEVSRLIHTPITEPRARLATLLGLLCGMRRGEVRGLQWGDIGGGLIRICHNWQDEEGIKAPKWGSGRIVPIPACIDTVLEEVRNTAMHPRQDPFVFASLSSGKPLGNHFFRYSLERELRVIGIGVEEQKHRNITFHSLRHTFVTLGRLAGITDLEIQTLAGHKSGAMMDHYSHAGQVLDFASAREKLEKAIGCCLF
ncbi:MAG: site-specific integrase [Treponema sp.]|jgi:integrase|nr:site-specific integrase [Treponema sp.]